MEQFSDCVLHRNENGFLRCAHDDAASVAVYRVAGWPFGGIGVGIDYHRRIDAPCNLVFLEFEPSAEAVETAFQSACLVMRNDRRSNAR